jgi:protein-L-isoaspartate O-methyltransferase
VSGRAARRPRQASLRRLRAFGVRPNRELARTSSSTDNILRVIGAAAELDAGDIVLEVGGGLGVLSEFLAPQVAHLHVVEVDRSLEQPLRQALAPFGNATLHLAGRGEDGFRGAGAESGTEVVRKSAPTASRPPCS